MIIDDFGSMMVLDNRNNRIQLISNELDFVGTVQVSDSLCLQFL